MIDNLVEKIKEFVNEKIGEINTMSFGKIEKINSDDTVDVKLLLGKEQVILHELKPFFLNTQNIMVKIELKKDDYGLIVWTERDFDNDISSTTDVIFPDQSCVFIPLFDKVNDNNDSVGLTFSNGEMNIKREKVEINITKDDVLIQQNNSVIEMKNDKLALKNNQQSIKKIEESLNDFAKMIFDNVEKAVTLNNAIVPEPGNGSPSAYQTGVIAAFKVVSPLIQQKTQEIAQNIGSLFNE